MLVLVLTFTGYTQSPEVFPDDIRQDVGCEMTAKVVEDVLREAQHSGERVFVISRIGIGEKKSQSWKRINFAEKRLSIEPVKDSLIFADGKPMVSAGGAMEFWLGSRPRAIIRFQSKQQFCIDTPTHN